MTDTQHKATPQQWGVVNGYVRRNGSSTESCLIELRDRISCLECLRKTENECILEIYKRLDNLKLQHESNWSRIVKLEEAQEAPAAATAPEHGSLVEVVADAITSETGSCHAEVEARAAIAATAEWLERRYRNRRITGHGLKEELLREAGR